MTYVEYPQSTTDVNQLEPMQGVELVYFVIPEAALWSVVHILFVLDGPLDFERLKNRVRHGYGHFHRLRQKPVRQGQRFFWENAGELRMDEHVKLIPADKSRTKADIEALIGGWLSQPLDPSRPLWEVHYAPQYEGGAAVVLRIHHAYGDGRSLQTIATSIVATSAEESARELPPSDPSIRNQAVAAAIRPTASRRSQSRPEGFFAHLWHRLRVRLRAYGKMMEAFKKDHDTGFSEVPSEQKAACFSRATSRARLREASTALGCTLNDLVLSGVSGALRNALLRQGVNPEQTRFTVSIPVDLHSPRSLIDMNKKGILTNHLGTVSVRLPIGVADGAERARLVARAMAEAMESGEALMQYKSLSGFHKMPQGLLVKVFRSQAHKLSGIISNLAGPKQPYFLCGQYVNSWLFWVVAAQLAGSHLGVSVTHYMDDVRVGVTLPMNAGYDVPALLEEMVAETERLADAALRSA